MTIKALLAASGVALALSSVPAAAEVVSRSESGFSLSFERPVVASADAIFAAVSRPAAWWSDAHTYSGSASNISLDMAPGGCWCEALAGGGVKHGETLMAWPERRMVRFDAPFGPLQSTGAAAVLTMTWAEAEGGAARSLKWTVVVEGAGSGDMADVIDGVIAEQFRRLADHLAASGGS
ncbi:MAG TPA: ATPase [Brevundimonas sp.]|nr:ATPase [Brevundimonas sp.]